MTSSMVRTRGGLIFGRYGILEEDRMRGKTQRHTAQRIFKRLCDEHSCTGGYAMGKDYVRLRTSVDLPALTAITAC